MSATRTPKFDAHALFDAVDAERRARGMTWQALAADVGVSVSTIRGMPKRQWGIELDGVACLTRWLGRTVESFAGVEGGPPPRPGSCRQTGRFLRFQTAALYAALDTARARRGLTWNTVAAEIFPQGPWGAAQLTGMARGGRADVHMALAACAWLGTTIQSFQHETIG